MCTFVRVFFLCLVRLGTESDVVLLPGGKAAGEASSLESIWGLVGLEAREFALMSRARTEEV